MRRRQVALPSTGWDVAHASVRADVSGGINIAIPSRIAQREALVEAVMRELAAKYRHYGYRRIQVFLGRRRHEMSADRATSVVASVWSVSAEKTAAVVDSDGSAAPVAGNGRGLLVCLRLCVRCMRERSVAEVSDGHRRVHSGMFSHRRCGQHPLRARH